MALLDPEHGIPRRNVRGPTPQYAKMPRAGRVIIDPSRLRYWRNMRLMTRHELAEAARLSYDSIVSYEIGRKFPREAAFRRLFTALGIGPEDLLFEDCRYILRKKESNDDHP
jgi:DNA-binding XRE family transcriptional regulator